jgi:hypothetical protein
MSLLYLLLGGSSSQATDEARAVRLPEEVATGA